MRCKDHFECVQGEVWADLLTVVYIGLASKPRNADLHSAGCMQISIHVGQVAYGGVFVYVLDGVGKNHWI